MPRNAFPGAFPKKNYCTKLAGVSRELVVRVCVCVWSHRPPIPLWWPCYLQTPFAAWWPTRGRRMNVYIGLRRMEHDMFSDDGHMAWFASPNTNNASSYHRIPEDPTTSGCLTASGLNIANTAGLRSANLSTKIICAVVQVICVVDLVLVVCQRTAICVAN